MDPALTLKGFGAAGALVSAIGGIFLAAEAAESLLGKRFVRAVVYALPITAVGFLIVILASQTGLHSPFLWVSLMLLVLAAIVEACFYARKPPATGPRDVRWAWVLLVLGFSLSLVQTGGEFVWAALGNK
jgi:hypothetical protein